MSRFNNLWELNMIDAVLQSKYNYDKAALMFTRTNDIGEIPYGEEEAHGLHKVQVSDGLTVYYQTPLEID